MRPRARRRRIWAAALGLLAGLLQGPLWNASQAAGAPGLPDGWLLGPLDTEFILTGKAAAGYGALTGSSTVGSGLWGAAGQGRLYGLEELSLRWVELGFRPRWRSVFPAVAATFERLGGILLGREKRSIHCRWGTNPRVGVGFSSSVWRLEAEAMEASLGAHLGCEMRFGLGGRMVGTVGLHLQPWEDPGWPGGPGRRRVLEIKLARPGSGLACRLDRLPDGVPVASFQGMVRLSPSFGLGFGGDPGTGSLGGNLVVRTGAIRLETSHLVHPVLGVTHRFMVGAGDPAASSR